MKEGMDNLPWWIVVNTHNTILYQPKITMNITYKNINIRKNHG